MQIRTLETLSNSEITTLFNRAFSDYFVKIQLNEKMLEEKILAEDIQLDKSVGVFVDNKAVGFILHAVRSINNIKTAYNAGTGVIPDYRGNKFTQQMYKYIIPVLRDSGIDKVQLEVMEQNAPAIQSYLNTGFQKIKNLECFKGSIKPVPVHPEITFKAVKNSELSVYRHFWLCEPSWQHALETLEKSGVYKSFGAFHNNQIAGYASFIPETGRIAQFAVDPDFRKQGIGSSIFQCISESVSNDLTVINVDGNYPEIHKFLNKQGLKKFIRQYLMEMPVH